MTLVCGQGELEALGAAAARMLRARDAVLLFGPLGAGKTTFARALIRAACGDLALDVPSPSYTLVQSYETARFALHHFDLWRLSGPDGVFDLGWEEARDGVVVVEWPERLETLAPADTLSVSLSPLPADRRLVSLDGWPGRLAGLVQAAGLVDTLPP